ncbi:hypothetical protein EVG20_g7775 [Dentipellis fragilis]|uniref:Cytochrome P450 n=1 Tax=Dentipellis fragilis TaxID=205917 RepID=A0A4Y9YC75_9AGAM|nr:hypothetical protein EVG20_g7775 [Dentipellis fragilis]
MEITALDISLAVVGLWLLKRVLTSRPSAPLPPGPKGFPLIGNVLDMPTSHEWVTFTRWAKEFGGLIYLNLLGQPFIIINSHKKAVEMLEKKSVIYSDRPVLTMGSELVGWKNTLALTGYGERFREYRRMLHRLMGTRSNMEKFHPIEELETHRFLRRVLENPDDLQAHIRKTAGAIILNMAYGYKIKDGDDPLVNNVEIAVDQFSEATAPGAFLVDVLPILRYVPGWVPGTAWKQLAKLWHDNLMTMVEMPLDFVKQQMATGDALPSFTSTYLENPDMNAEQEHVVKWAAASLYSGGADTTVSATYSLFLALAIHPEVQRKAQAEIDAVIGTDRLPTFHDRERLPYVDAIVKEILRWNPVGPLGVPHRLMEDDMQDGYLIPKGSIVVANIWKFLHDEQTYVDPIAFNPDRFMPSAGKEPEVDPRTYVFGFGRRICPGLNLADASMFISVAMVLAVFDISKAVENGRVVEPVVEYTGTTISHPKPFKCSVKPRSEKAAALIKSVRFNSEE